MDNEQKNPVPGGQVTGDDKADLASIIREAIKETVGDQKDAKTEAKQPEPLTLKIGGEDRQFQSLEELQAAINSTLETYQAAYRELAGSVKKPPEPSPQQGQKAFDRDTFIAKMNENPVDGLRYALSYAIFDGEVDNPAVAIKAGVQKAFNLEQQLAAYQFRQQHPEIAEILQDPKEGPRALGTMTQVMRELGYNSLSVPGLEAGYAVAVQRGLLKPPQSQKTQSGNPAPPTFGRSTVSDASDPLNDLSRFEELPYEKRVAILRRMEGR